MKINFNGKQTLVIAGAAAASGLIIFLGSKGVEAIRAKKHPKNEEEEPAKEEAEEPEK